ncbi:MAG: hypothetical protein ACLSWI_07165 [Candidatus Gastranaerophilaceae bacterium]
MKNSLISFVNFMQNVNGKNRSIHAIPAQITYVRSTCNAGGGANI